MRTTKWLVAAALVVLTTGCVETVDQGYGYSDGYYSNGYYAQPAYARPVVNNYYTTYTPAPVVVSQTRVVSAPEHHADRSNAVRTAPANNNRHDANNGNGSSSGHNRDHDRDRNS